MESFALVLIYSALVVLCLPAVARSDNSSPYDARIHDKAISKLLEKIRKSGIRVVTGLVDRGTPATAGTTLTPATTSPAVTTPTAMATPKQYTNPCKAGGSCSPVKRKLKLDIPGCKLINPRRKVSQCVGKCNSCVRPLVSVNGELPGFKAECYCCKPVAGPTGKLRKVRVHIVCDEDGTKVRRKLWVEAADQCACQPCAH